MRSPAHVRAAQESRGLLGGTPGGGATGDVCSQVRRDGDERRQGFWCDAELGVPPSGRGDGEAAEAVPGAQSRRLLALRDVPRHVHRGGQAFVVALGVDLEGKKLPLGFWEGATENHEICEELLEGLERRGLKLSKRVLWVTDGGGGIIKALKDRYGKKLIHQRCTLHKDRNIQRHLPKRYRKQAHHLFATALEQNSYRGREEDVAGVRANGFATSTSRRQTHSSSHSRRY